MKNVLILVLIGVCLSARADWVQDSVAYEVDSTDPKEMATALTLFPSTLNWLNAQNLTSPSRLVVQKIIAKIADYHWENDSNCAVLDPGLIKPIRMSSSHSDFYFEAKPVEVWHLDVMDTPVVPCEPGPPPPPTIAKSRKI